MSEDISCTITPPDSPGLSDNVNDTFNENNCTDEEVQNTHSSFRWFSCLGEAKTSKICLHDDGYLGKGEFNFLSTIGMETLSKTSNGRNKEIIHLFGHAFDKGCAIFYNCKILFRMVRSELMLLENASKLNNRVLGLAPGRSTNKDYREIRRNCISLFLYIRNYLSRLPFLAEYNWVVKELFPILAEQVSGLRLLLRQITHLPDYILHHASNPLGNKCSQPAYHLFHCHLDLRWLHTTTVVAMANIKAKTDVTDSQLSEYGSVFDQRKCVNNSTVEQTITLLVSDLIMLAISRFEKIDSQDLLHKSAFSCSCVGELWILLQILTDELESQGKSKSFWSYLNRVLEDVLNAKIDDASVRHNCAILHRPAAYPCSNPLLFSIFLIKHLAHLYKYKDREMKSNYSMLETVLKTILNSELHESQLRTILALLHDLLLNYWEPRTENVILLWDYFHKRLNATFYLAGTSLDSMGVVSKSALGLITQVTSRLEDNADDRHSSLNSFHMFLKILGLHLRRTSTQERHWKQLRGRVYSKLSASKIAALSEIGLYNFVSLFITMAVSADLVEVTSKLHHFLSMIAENELDLGRRQVIWRAELASCILLAEKGLDFCSILTPLYQKVETMVADLKGEHALPLMRTFVEAVQDILDCNDRITSSHHLLFGNWISRYLADCPTTDASRLLDAILLVINRLKNQIPDPGNIVVQNSLWEYLVPYLRSKCSNESAVYQVADIAFGLSVLSVNMINSQEHFRDMFTTFVTSDTFDVRLTRRFLCQMIHHRQFPQNIMNYKKLIFKAWIKCLTLSLDLQHTEILQLTGYIAEMPGFWPDNSVVCAEDPLLHLFGVFADKFNNAKDVMEKGRMREDASYIFEGMDQWLRPTLKAPKNQELTSRIYFIVGKMISEIPSLLYTKSKPNSVLKTLLDLLLLPITIRNPDSKLHPYIVLSISSSLHLYIEGLVQLGPQQDPYISRTVRELITLYLPRCVAKPGSLAATSPGKFTLVNCVKFDDEVSKIILETVNTMIIKKKAKIPHIHCSQALKFLSDILSLSRHDTNVVATIIKYSLDCVCDVMMFCEDTHCKRQARDIVFSVLNCDVIRLADLPGEELMFMFSRLCREYLAFTSRQLFDLLHDMLSHGPDLVARFMPTLLNHVKEVETKRGVGYDRSLRMGVERLDMAIKSVRK